MLVACPGCGDPLKMPSNEVFTPGTVVVVPEAQHECKVLGTMPNPFDPAALMLWMSGSLTDSQTTPTVDEVEATVKEKKPPRKHVPFDSTECTKEGCTVYGKVPGVRRHIGFMHPDEAEELLAKMPPNRTIDGLISYFEKEEPAAQNLIDGLGLRSRFPVESDAWSWEDAAAAVLNLVEEKS